jgi:ABC-type lipoprotein release transport system permease subunit
MLALVVQELWHRKLNFLLGALAVTVAVGLTVAYVTTADAARRETVRVTRDMGFNLRIIPRATDMDRFWSEGFSELTMPEDSVKKFVAYTNAFFAFNHLVASLQRRFPVGDREVILTGLAPTVTAAAQEGRPMGFEIKPGTAHLGFEVAQRLGRKQGDIVELGGRRFSVARALVESGTEDDVRVFVALKDAQQLLGLEGRINEIKAIDCLCLTADKDPISILRAELEKALPEAKVLQMRVLADARARQRRMTEQYAAFVTPVLLIVCAVWVGALAALNVRERRAEIGVLRALGFGSGPIAGLFLAKAAALGWVGAFAGYWAGSALALRFGPQIFQVTAKSIAAQPALLGWALIGAPLFAAIAMFIPTVLAVTQDPAVTLREE